VYVKNFPTTWTEETLKSIFGKYGEITSLALFHDHAHRPFAFINFAEPAAAKACIEGLHGKKTTATGLVEENDHKKTDVEEAKEVVTSTEKIEDKSVKKEEQVVPETKNEQVVSETKNEQVVPETKNEQVVPETKNEQVVPETKNEQVVPETKNEQVVPETKNEQVVPETKNEQVVDGNAKENDSKQVDQVVENKELEGITSELESGLYVQRAMSKAERRNHFKQSNSPKGLKQKPSTVNLFIKNLDATVSLIGIKGVIFLFIFFHYIR
jgi:outer membrane biosynthesis protein TonB